MSDKPTAYQKQQRNEETNENYTDLANCLKRAALISEEGNFQRRMALAKTRAEESQLWFNAAMNGVETFDEDDNG